MYRPGRARSSSPARPASAQVNPPINLPRDARQPAPSAPVSPVDTRAEQLPPLHSIMQRFGNAKSSNGPSERSPPTQTTDARLIRRDITPKRSSTVGSPGEQDRERDYFDKERGKAGSGGDPSPGSVNRLNSLPPSIGERPWNPMPAGYDVQVMDFAHQISDSPNATPRQQHTTAQAQQHTPSPIHPPSQPPFTNRVASPAPSIHSDISHTTATSTTQASSSVPRPPSSAGSDVSLPSTTHTQTTISQPICCSCNMVMTGQFVRALGNVYHLDCFRCLDCDRPVAQKFFPIEGADGKQQPLCERDYFRRLNLICGNCGEALRGSYITACNKKFHVEHFTCSVCPTLFGQSDSYYEHAGDVYCHFHYSTRFATKCVGCASAILRQFVEINRNSRIECWHPECYMIHRFWNVKMTSKLPPSEVPPLPPDPNPDGTPPELQPTYQQEEATETAASLRDKQTQMEQQVERIWSVLSAYEESSATCIQNLLTHVANGHWLDAILFAEKFILHVEVLFAVIDDLESQFARMNAKGMSHVREARMLCRKTVDLFTLLSRSEATVDRRMRFTEDLLAVVTGLAHYLKILIRIALTGSLKLEREYRDKETGTLMLDKLHALVQTGANPSAKRKTRAIRGGMPGTQGVLYGYKCLAPENAGPSPFSAKGSTDPANMESPSDLCVECKVTVEEDCVRLGTYLRWHSQCLKCTKCGRTALAPTKEKNAATSGEDAPAPPKHSNSRRPPALAQDFLYRAGERKSESINEPVPLLVLCVVDGEKDCKPGFEAVTKLEQFAFLLNVALRRLYDLLRIRGWMALPGSVASSDTSSDTRSLAESYRDSTEIMRLKSVHLDRKLSATARLPKRSTIVESPSGKIAQPTDATVHSSITSRLAAAHQQAAAEQQPAHGPPYANQYRQQHAPVPTRPAPPPPSHPQAPAQPSSRLQSTSPAPVADGVAVIRPSFARNNTSVRIIADSDDLTLSPDPGTGHDNTIPETVPEGLEVDDDAITLADIPQMVEAEQAREQHRSLPRQTGRPMIADLDSLQLMILKHFAVLLLNRSPLKDQLDLDEILELVEVKNKTLWHKIFKAEKKNPKKKGSFGVPLDLLVEREGVDSLLGATKTPVRVPSLVDDLVSAMKQMDMSVEGVFRKNGNIRKLKELADTIDRDPASVDLGAENPVQLAALLKKFLGDLPEPLLTFKLHKLFCATQKFSNADDRRKYLHLVYMLLPKYNRDTTEVLFVFLKWVACFAHVDLETGSKMDLQNLATVISPSILYAKGRDPAKDEIFLSIRVVGHLLEQQDDFNAVPDEFVPILHDMEYFVNCAELPRKEILKKCDVYWRLKHSKPGANGGLPTSNSFNNGLSQVDVGRADNDVRLVTRRSDPALMNMPPPPPPGLSHANGRRTPQGMPTQSPHPPLSHEAFGQPYPSWEDANVPTGSPPNGSYAQPSRNGSYDNQRQLPPQQHEQRWNQQQFERPPPGSRPVSYVRNDQPQGFPPPSGRQSPGMYPRQ